MAVVFLIPGALRQFTRGDSVVEVEKPVANLREALGALWELHPGLRDRIVTEQGEVREHINIFVGNEDVRYTGELGARIDSDCEISIVPAISGGS